MMAANLDVHLVDNLVLRLVAEWAESWAVSKALSRADLMVDCSGAPRVATWGPSRAECWVSMQAGLMVAMMGAKWAAR
jgi:hypothetical protein